MKYIELNHRIEHETITYPGLPGPVICDFWTREQSAERYDDGSSFLIARIDMVANTGTYIDAPYHRFADGVDIAGLDLDRVAGVPGCCVHIDPEVKEIGPDWFHGIDLAGRAVLVHTGWDRHWGSDAYFGENPYLSTTAAELLRNAGAALVGIDSLNIDNAATRARPVHTALLGAGIPLVEHMCGLDDLPDSDFAFYAVPPRICGMGTFPVRAFALGDTR